MKKTNVKQLFSESATHVISKRTAPANALTRTNFPAISRRASTSRLYQQFQFGILD